MIVSGDRRVAYADLEKEVARAAAGFSSLGVGEGDAVALMLRNDIAFFEAAAAANAIGANVVPINWHLKAGEAGYILRDSGARALVCHADLVPQIESEVPPEMPVFLVETPAEIERAYDLQPAVRPMTRHLPAWSAWVEAQPQLAGPLGRGASIIYTSGTTGLPKGVTRPRPRVLELVERLPREDSGKIFKRRLREAYWQGRQRRI